MFNFLSKPTDSMPSVGSMQDLEALFAQESLVLFKHSPTCALSLAAYAEVARFREAQPEAPVHVVSVRSQRDLARYVAARTGVPHASPQVIIMRRGAVVATASHWEITSDFL